MRTLEFLRSNIRWLGAGFLLTFTSSYGQTYFISLFAPQIRDTFGLSNAGWGLTYAVGTLLSAALMVWAGTLVDRFRVRVIGAIVCFGLAGATLVMANITQAWMVVIAIFLLRFAGQGMASHIAVVAMARWFVATRGRALSIATLGFSLGEAVLPILVVAALALVDWRLIWVAAALASVASAVVLWSSLKEERSPAAVAQDNQSAGLDGRHWARSEVVRMPIFWALVLAVAGKSAFGTAFFFHHTVFAADRGWSHAEIVALFPVYTGATILSMLAFGALLDRLGTPRMLPFYLLLTALGFVVVGAVPSLAGALIGMVLMGMGQGANSTLPNAFWAEAFGTRNIGGIKSLATAVMVLGSAIGPGLTGALIDQGVSLSTQFIWIGIYFVGVCAVIFVTLAPLRARLPGAA